MTHDWSGGGKVGKEASSKGERERGGDERSLDQRVKHQTGCKGGGDINLRFGHTDHLTAAGGFGRKKLLAPRRREGRVAN